MKKILIFSLAYYPRVGGAEVAIKEITDRIADIEFHMLTLRFSPQDAKREKVGNVIVHRIGGGSHFSKICFPLSSARAARALHAQERFDGQWAMMSYMVLPIVLANLGIPYALTLQEGDTEHYMFRRLRILPFLPLMRRGFRRARAVSALSHFLAAWAGRMGYQGAVEVIPNGADVRKFEGEPIAHEGTVLITSSRLVHKNAVDDCLRALARLPSVRFLIAGTGPDEGPLKNLARELGVQDRVEWLGYVDHARLPALLHAADIFIRPSRSEGFGASFAEAMAARVPVIATQEGGIADFLFDEKRNPGIPSTGWAVDKDSPEQIAEAVRDILADPAKTKRVVETAHGMVREKYDWDLIAKDMCEKIFQPLFV